MDKAAFADADLVIEAVFEDLAVKKQVSPSSRRSSRPECVLATNTSSLSVTAMAADLEHPERVVGFHFFNPVAVMPLLEIVRAERTDDATLATAFAVGKAAAEVLRAGQGRARVRGQPAAHPVPRRGLRGGRRGHARSRSPTPRSTRSGLPMRPLALLHLVGPAVRLHVGETLHEAFPDRFGVSENLRRIVAGRASRC